MTGCEGGSSGWPWQGHCTVGGRAAHELLAGRSSLGAYIALAPVEPGLRIVDA